MAYEVEVDGLDRVRAHLGRLPDGVARRADEATRKAAQDTVRLARQRAPVDTGALRSSITMRTSRDADGVEARVGPTVRYARWVEEGTSRMGPQPYMRPAFDANRTRYVTALQQIIQQELR